MMMLERRNNHGLPVLDPFLAVPRPNVRVAQVATRTFEPCHTPACRRMGLILCEGVLWCESCYAVILDRCSRTWPHRLAIGLGLLLVLAVLVQTLVP